jgi:hypothetical protein
MFLIALGAAAPGVAQATLSRTSESSDGVTEYQTDNGDFYVSSQCHSAGNSTDAGNLTIGPGYVYRWDQGGGEVIQPQTNQVPSIGFAPFVADVYQGPTTLGGTFESVQGNMCRGDNSGLATTQNSGVVASQLTSTGSGGTGAGAYLSAVYDVWLADQAGGNLFLLTYTYRFHADSVELWTRARVCPDGSCPSLGAGGPYIKMPKWIMSVSGPSNDYTSIDCWNTDGTLNLVASQVDNPNGSTIGNHCNGNGRDYVAITGSRGYLRGAINIEGKAQPTASYGPGGTLYPWEVSAASTHYGLDNLSWLRQTTGHLNSSGLNCPGGDSANPIRSWHDVMRNWEMWGDDGTHAYAPYDAKGVFFKGWEDGNGPQDCTELYNLMVAN